MYLLLLILCIPAIYFKPIFSVVVVCLTYLIKADFDKREAQANERMDELEKKHLATKQELIDRIDSLRTTVTGSKLGGLIGGR